MSFDLKVARAVCDKIKRKNWNIDDGIDIRYLNIQCAEILPDAVDEIERQNTYIEQLSKQCQAFIHDEEMYGWIQDHHDLEMIVPCKLLDVAKKWHAAYRKAQNSNLVRKQLCEQKDECISEQAKRIVELEAIFLDLREFLVKRKLVDSDQLDGCVAIAHAVKDAILKLTSEESELVSTFEQRSPGRYRYLENKVRILDQMYKDDCSEMRKLHAALKKLGQAKRERGKALVEERARGNHYGMSYEDASDGEIERWIIDGEIDAPKVYIERMRVEARSQLRREGKL